MRYEFESVAFAPDGAEVKLVYDISYEINRSELVINVVDLESIDSRRPTDEERVFWERYADKHLEEKICDALWADYHEKRHFRRYTND